MKRVLFIWLALVSSVSASSVSIFLATTDINGIASGSTVSYLLVDGDKGTSTTEADVIQYIPPGTLSNLRCDIDAPQNPGTFTMTVRVGAADTSLACTVAALTLFCIDGTHSAAVASDPRVSIKVTPASSPGANTQLGCSLFFKRT